MVAALLLARWQSGHNEAIEAATAASEATQLAEQLANHLQGYEKGVRGARGALLVGGQEHMSRRSFQIYIGSRDMDQEFPGTGGFGFIRRVPRSIEAAFLDEARRTIEPGFAIRPENAHADERYVIALIEPSASNFDAWGFDLASDLGTRNAAEIAMRTGLATLTPPLPEAAKRATDPTKLLLLLPLYGSGAPISSDTDKSSATVGWAFAVLNPAEVFRHLAGVDYSQMTTQVEDVTAGSVPSLVFRSGEFNTRLPSQLTMTRLRNVFGRQWRFTVQPTSDFLRAMPLVRPSTHIWLGSISSVLVGTLLAILLTRARRERDHELAAADRFSQALEATPIGIVVVDRSNHIVRVNSQAETLFGYSREHLLGSLIDSVIPGFRAWAGVLAQPGDLPPNYTLTDNESLFALCKNGQRMPVKIHAQPLRSTSENAILISIVDLTQRKRAEELHQEMLALVESAEDAILTKNLEGIVRSWNPAAQRLLGYTAEEMVGSSVTRLLPGDRLHEEADIISRVARGQSVAHFETFRVRKDGSLVEVSLTISPIRDRTGRVVGASKIMRDITDRKQIESQLSKSRERFAIASQAAGHGFWDLDLQSRLLFWDEQMFRLYGRPQTDGAQTYAFWVGSLHPADRARFEQELSAAIAGERPFDTEFRIVLTDGAVRHIRALARISRDPAGVALQLFGLSFDITERKRTTEQLLTLNAQLDRALRASQSFLGRVGAVAGVGGWELDLPNDRLTWSDETYRIHEVPPDYKPTPDDAYRFFSPQSVGIIKQSVRDCLVRELSFDLELEMISAGGKYFWARVTGAAESEGGEVVRLVGSVQNVTARRTLEAQLRAAMEAAQKANRAKSEFLANMSHEIRTPLNAVIGLSYLLEQTRLSEDQRQFLTKIEFAGRALLGVVNNVLDLSKIEAGEMSLEEDRFDLRELLQDVSNMLAPQAVAKGIRLVSQVSNTLPRAVIGDSTRLRQILINLLNNSIKFTEIGEVGLRVTADEGNAERIRLRCEVEDSGIGIEPETMARLFTPFTQADGSTTRRFGGTGLGLSICKRFTDLMGGEIGVSSNIGSGSRFWVEIPLRTAGELSLTESCESAREVRVLIADAEIASHQELSALVRALGWTPQSCQSKDALRAIMENSPARARPDVVLVNLSSSGMDPLQWLPDNGFETESDHLPPLLFVSSDTQSYLRYSHRLRSKDTILVRPVNSSMLFNAVNAALWRHDGPFPRGVQPTRTDDPGAQWLCGVRVLVVDDSDINLEVARRILDRQGALVTCRSNGSAALEFLRSEGDKTDLVLMDVQMPVMDGIAAAASIRTELKLESLPIVALTAGALVGERQRTLDAGMNDFISKPFDPQALIRKIRDLVERARGAPLPMTISTVDSTGSDGIVMSLPSLDTAVVERMFGGDRALFENLLTRLLREYSDLSLPTCVSRDDLTARKALAERMHKLKGSAGMIGAVEVARLAGDAESVLKGGPKGVDVAALLAELAATLTRLQEEARTILAHSTRETPSMASSERAGGSNDIESLHALLESHNLAAVDSFASASYALSQRLSPARFDRLRTAIDNLDFAIGARLLEEELNGGDQTIASEAAVS